MAANPGDSDNQFCKQIALCESHEVTFSEAHFYFVCDGPRGREQLDPCLVTPILPARF